MLQLLENPVIRMVTVVIVADCNLYIPDTSIHQDIFLLDTVDGTLTLLSSVFPVSVEDTVARLHFPDGKTEEYGSENTTLS